MERIHLPVATDSNDRFKLISKTYSQQYSHLYLLRLKALRERIRCRAASKWGKSLPVEEKIIDAEINQHGDECVLIGTLYKNLMLRSSVLDEFKDNLGLSGATINPMNNLSSSVSSIVYYPTACDTYIRRTVGKAC